MKPGRPLLRCGPKPGYKQSVEHKAKLAAAKRQRYEDPAERAKTAGALNGRWLGDDVGSDAAHRRHRKVLPRECAHVDDTCKGPIQCAFDHDTPSQFVKVHPDGPYSTRSEDYMPLCASHHARYDAKR